MPWIGEVIKFFSSSLFFLMDQILMLVFISPMPTSMISGTWSNGFQILGWSICWPNPILSGGRKIRSITELASCRLSANLVGPGFEEGNSFRPKLSAIVMRLSVWVKWCWKLGSCQGWNFREQRCRVTDKKYTLEQSNVLHWRGILLSDSINPKRKLWWQVKDVGVEYDFNEWPWLQLMCCTPVSSHKVVVYFRVEESCQRRGL